MYNRRQPRQTSFVEVPRVIITCVSDNSGIRLPFGFGFGTESLTIITISAPRGSVSRPPSALLSHVCDSVTSGSLMPISQMVQGLRWPDIAELDSTTFILGLGGRVRLRLGSNISLTRAPAARVSGIQEIPAQPMSLPQASDTTAIPASSSSLIAPSFQELRLTTTVHDSCHRRRSVILGLPFIACGIQDSGLSHGRKLSDEGPERSRYDLLRRSVQ